MVGARITIDVVGLDRTQKRLAGMVKAGRDLTPLMRDIGEYLLRTTRDRFEDERGPDGAPWQPLSEATRRRKRRNKDRILTESGHLGGPSLSYRASPSELLLGSSAVYAGTHQFGAKKGSFGATSKGEPIPWGDIPAREFLGLSDADGAEIEELIGDYLLRRL